MNHEELLNTVEGMLGFRIQEREHDAVLVRAERRIQGKIQRATRPATADEAHMFTRLLEVVAGLHRAQTLIAEGKKLLEEAQAIREVMGRSLQAADARIKELMTANKGLGEEREFLAEVHSERIKSMHAKNDAGLIAAAERMQEEWLKRFEEKEAEFTRMENSWRGDCEDLRLELRSMRSMLENAESAREHAEEQRDAAHDAANDMHAKLSDAEQQILELKEEIAARDRDHNAALDADEAAVSEEAKA